jgi:hypothetical protein
VPLPNKEATTVANAIFDKWYSQFGAPLDIVTDQGKEFCAKLSDELFKRLRTTHLTTSPHHPQCNSQAEVANKTIAKYLASFCDDSTLDWELNLAPLMFSYNTSFHRSIKSSPFFLTFGMEPHLLHLPTPDLWHKFYGKSPTDNIIRKLLFAPEVARQNNKDASDTACQQFNSRAAPHKFLLQQLVLVDEHSFLHKKKLAPKWSGPHKIMRLRDESNIKNQLKHNNRKTVVHANRPKPDFVASKNLAVCPDFFEARPPLQQFPDDVHPRLPEDYSSAHCTLLPNFGEVRLPLPSPATRTHTIAPAHTNKRTRTASSSSSSSSSSCIPEGPLENAPPAMRTRARTRSGSSTNSTPAKTQLFMPQVVFHLLPVLQEGEGLEDEENENVVNDGVTVNFVNGANSWTLVQRRKKKKVKKTIKKKSETSSSKKISNGLVISPDRSPIKVTRLLTSHHQLQMCLCSSTFNHQTFSPIHCPYHLLSSLHCQYHTSSLHCRRGLLHQMAAHVLSSRPFQKRTSHLSHSKKDLRTYFFQKPKILHLAAHNSLKHKWHNQQKEEETEEIINTLMTGFERLLDAWPFHLQEINELGQTRYHLTCLEKEHLKSLGL